MSDARERVGEAEERSADAPAVGFSVESVRDHRRLLTALALGVVLDVLTTTVGVPMDGITETNPVVAAAFAVIGWPAFPLYYLVLGTLVAGVVRLVPVPRRWVVRAGWAVVAVFVVTVLNNVVVLLTHG